MRNPSRTPQDSIFEPLFFQEEHPQTHLTHSPSSEWLTSTYSAPPSNNQLRRAPTAIFTDDLTTHPAHIGRNGVVERSASHRGHPNCSPIHHNGHKKFSSSSTDHTPANTLVRSAPHSRSLSLSNVDPHEDDGSVAAKLLTSITKSISSPSLLSCCKESARETPYQKTLRLRMMKLQHCAEELGSESSDCTSTYSDGGNDSCFDSLSTMATSTQSAVTRVSSCARSSLSTMPQMDQRSECDASPMMISVRSAPDLRCSSLVQRHTTHVRERSFPPPLTHTLPRSASAHSFSLSLRGYREDGRFVLREVKVPCQQYLQANRKDGRLTLQLFTADDDVEQEVCAQQGSDGATDVQRDETLVDMTAASVRVQRKEVVGCGYGNKLGIESASRNFVGGVLGVIGVKEGVDGIMNEVDNDTIEIATSDARKDGDLGARSLLMATSNADCGGKADNVSQFGNSCTRRANVNGVKCKLQNRPSFVCLRILSCPWKLNTLVPGNIPRLKVSPVTTFSHCEDLVWQSRLRRKSEDKVVKAMLELDIVPASLQGAGFGIEDRAVRPNIVFKDIDAKSLMENETKLVSSFSLDGSKWCQRKAMARGLEGCDFKDSHLKDSSMYDSIRSIKIGEKKSKENGAGKANGVSVEGEHETSCIEAFEGDGGVGIRTGGVSTTLDVDVQMPLHFNRVHSLHCKEPFRRNQLGSKGLISWVAIRT